MCNIYILYIISHFFHFGHVSINGISFFPFNYGICIKDSVNESFVLKSGLLHCKTNHFVNWCFLSQDNHYIRTKIKNGIFLIYNVVIYECMMGFFLTLGKKDF